MVGRSIPFVVLSVCLTAALDSLPVRAEPMFENDAATIGTHRVSASLNGSIGSSPGIETGAAPGVGVSVEVGLTPAFQIGGWLDGTLNGSCFTPGGCFTGTGGGGLRARLGLWRSRQDRFQLGVELGAGAQSVTDGVTVAGFQVDGALRASVKLPPVCLLYARGGFAWFDILPPIGGSERLPFFGAGVEFLPGRTHVGLDYQMDWDFFSWNRSAETLSSLALFVNHVWG